jgi:hypothetical protein
MLWLMPSTVVSTGIYSEQVADYIAVASRYPAWAPAPEVELGPVLHRFTIPLLGIVGQHGVQYLYRCLAGQADEFNLWSYTLLHDAEAERVRSASSDDIADVLKEVTSGRGCVVAFASAEHGIGLSEIYEQGLAYGEDIGGALDLLQQSASRAVEEIGALREPQLALAR